MTATISLLLDEHDTDEFIVNDWETTELPVPVTDQATPAAEPPTAASPPENFPNNPEPAIEAFLYKGDPIYDPNDNTLYVRNRCYAPKLQRFTPRDPAERC